MSAQAGICVLEGRLMKGWPQEAMEVFPIWVWGIAPNSKILFFGTVGVLIVGSRVPHMDRFESRLYV